jgi:DNA-binding beta-propeller fold protein YncE
MNRRRFLQAAVAGSVALATEPAAFAARLGGAAVAFVTADLESHVVVVDLDTASVVKRIRTGPGPRSIESIRHQIAVVGHTEHGVVTLIDAVSSRIRAELDAFEAPRYAAVHPRRPFAYVTDSAREELVAVDAEHARVLWRTRVPGPARHVSVSPDGRMLWTALGTAATSIAVLDTGDPRRPKLVRTVAPPFPAHDVVFSPDSRTVWVTSGAERRIALFRDGDRLVRILGAGAHPQHVAFAADKAFVASGDDGTIRRHRLDGTLVREARVPTGSHNVTFGWRRLVTPSLGGGTVSLLDRNGRVEAVRRVARAAHDACIVLVP